jgi:hypothetical protein
MSRRGFEGAAILKFAGDEEASLVQQTPGPARPDARPDLRWDDSVARIDAGS